MFLHYRTQGLIIKREDRGEADRIFNVYTKDFGKIEVLGKGIRKIASKLKSGMEPFYLSEIEFVQGRAYKTLTDAISLERFLNIRRNLKKLAVVFKVAEILDYFLKEEKDERLWKFLIDWFYRVNSSLNVSKIWLFYYFFLWNFFSILGYTPELYSCVICQKKLKEEKNFFLIEEGGVSCKNCALKLKSKREISPETIKILRIILRGDLAILQKIKFNNSIKKELKEVSDEYLIYFQEL